MPLKGILVIPRALFLSLNSLKNQFLVLGRFSVAFFSGNYRFNLIFYIFCKESTDYGTN